MDDALGVPGVESVGDLDGRGPVAAFGSAPEGRRLVLDQLATAAGKDGRPIAETPPLLLVTNG